MTLFPLFCERFKKLLSLSKLIHLNPITKAKIFDIKSDMLACLQGLKDETLAAT